MSTETAETRTSAPFSAELIDAFLNALSDQVPARPSSVTVCYEHSNDLAEIRFPDGRTLMLKRARATWAAERFEASRRAAVLLRERVGVVAPNHLPLPQLPGELPCLAYWRIPLPTLKELWPDIPRRDRADVLRSWGALIRRIHGLEFRGYGAIARAPHLRPPLAAFLEEDLETRLFPAVANVWPDGLEALQRLIDAVPAVAADAHGTGVLVHNDMHMANVLCEVEDAAIRCVGLLDLEAAFVGPWEVDLAVAQVLHGPLFAQPLEGAWLEPVLQGYGSEPDPRPFAFFRACHLVNMGFHAALVGHEHHARDVARAALRAAEALDPAPGRTVPFGSRCGRRTYEIAPDPVPGYR